MKDYISIVLDDDTEINFYEKTKKKQTFLKLASDDILGTENEILIYLDKNHLIPVDKTYIWQSCNMQIQNDECTKISKIEAEKDYSGYANCLKIQKIVKKDSKLGTTKAIDYCLSLNKNGYQGYLPSMGQLRLICDNLDMINYIFVLLGVNQIKLSHTYQWWLSRWWSSTECNMSFSWDLNHGQTCKNSKINNQFRILPLFAKHN